MKVDVKDNQPKKSKALSVLRDIGLTTAGFLGPIFTHAIWMVPLCIFVPAAIIPCAIVVGILAVFGAVFALGGIKLMYALTSEFMDKGHTAAKVKDHVSDHVNDASVSQNPRSSLPNAQTVVTLPSAQEKRGFTFGMFKPETHTNNDVPAVAPVLVHTPGV